MNRSTKPWLLVLVMALLTTGCGQEVQSSPITAAPPTAASQAELLPTVSASPPPTAAPATTIAPSATAVVQPEVPTPQPTATTAVTATVTATATIQSASLPCSLDPAPRPTYERGVPGSLPWPAPVVSADLQRPDLAWPVNPSDPPRINLDYGYGADGNGRFLIHNGLDLGEPAGVPVLAVADGTVVVAGPDAEEMYGRRCDWYGNLVVVELDRRIDGQPMYALYGHVLDLVVEEGQKVRQEQPLAHIGFGGVATAPHLHLEIRVGENGFAATHNPLLYLRPPEGYGAVAGRLLDESGHSWQGVTITLIDRSGEQDFQYTTTYLGDPDGLIHPDAAWGENFAFAVVAPGDYDVFAQIGTAEIRQRVRVEAGQIAFAEILLPEAGEQ